VLIIRSRCHTEGTGERSERSPALRQGSPGVTRWRGAGLSLQRQGQNNSLPPRPFTVCASLPATIASPSWASFLRRSRPGPGGPGHTTVPVRWWLVDGCTRPR